MNALSLVEKIACLSSEDKEWLERLLDRFLATPARRKGCDCHVIDPKKQDMIIWPSLNEKHPDDLIVKFANQRSIAMPRVDKRGQKYWKVREFYEDEGQTAPSINSLTSKTETYKLSEAEKLKQQIEAQNQLAGGGNEPTSN